MADWKKRSEDGASSLLTASHSLMSTHVAGIFTANGRTWFPSDALAAVKVLKRKEGRRHENAMDDMRGTKCIEVSTHSNGVMAAARASEEFCA